MRRRASSGPATASSFTRTARGPCCAPPERIERSGKKSQRARTPPPRPDARARIHTRLRAALSLTRALLVRTAALAFLRTFSAALLVEGRPFPGAARGLEARGGHAEHRAREKACRARRG